MPCVTNSHRHTSSRSSCSSTGPTKEIWIKDGCLAPEKQMFQTGVVPHFEIKHIDNYSSKKGNTKTVGNHLDNETVAKLFRMSTCLLASGPLMINKTDNRFSNKKE